jgi:hypothetical protein
LDGRGSVSPSNGVIVTYAWSTPDTPYTGTPNSASGERATLVFLASEGTVDVTLTVTDTTSKIGTITETIDLSGADRPLLRRAVSVAFGSAWEVTPDGGLTWNEATSLGAVTHTPPYAGGVDDRAPAADYALLANGDDTIYSTVDHLDTAPTALAILLGDVTALWQNEADPTRVWAAVGPLVYRSVDGGATFTAMSAPSGDDVVWLMEDPAVENSVFALAGADFWVTTAPATAGAWAVLYEGPAGAVARQFVRSRDGQITWVCYTGTFTGDPVQRVETGAGVVFPGTPPTEIQTLALDPDAASDGAATLYLWDDAGNIYTADGITGLDGALSTQSHAAGETPMHAIHDPDAPIVYVAVFGTTAGAVYKLLTQSDRLLLFRQGASGRQAHMLGLAPGVAVVHVALLMVGGNVGAGTGVYRSVDLGATWVSVSGDLPSSGWAGIVAAADDDWIVYKNGAAYRTVNGGVNWTALTGVASGVSGNQAYIIRGVAFDPEDTNDWAIVGSRQDTGALENRAFVTRGSGTAGTATTSWIADSFVDGSDDIGIPSGVVFGDDGDLVVATDYYSSGSSGTSHGSWLLYPGGTLSGQGTDLGQTDTITRAIDRQPDNPRVLAVASDPGGVRGEVWHALHYASIAPEVFTTADDADANTMLRGWRTLSARRVRLSRPMGIRSYGCAPTDSCSKPSPRCGLTAARRAGWCMTAMGRGRRLRCRAILARRAPMCQWSRSRHEKVTAGARKETRRYSCGVQASRRAHFQPDCRRTNSARQWHDARGRAAQ